MDLSAHPNVITDGATRKLEDLILTTIPYHCSKEEKAIWLDGGFTIRGQTGKPWMVLHHFPPKTESGMSGEESEAAGLLLAYRPDYFVSGHDHAFPYKSGQSWNQRMGGVCVLVPGQLMSAPFPNHIKLDTESGESSWHTIRQIWMPEDERFEYLLAKFAKD